MHKGNLARGWKPGAVEYRTHTPQLRQGENSKLNPQSICKLRKLVVTCETAVYHVIRGKKFRGKISTYERDYRNSNDWNIVVCDIERIFCILSTYKLLYVYPMFQSMLPGRELFKGIAEQ